MRHLAIIVTLTSTLSLPSQSWGQKRLLQAGRAKLQRLTRRITDRLQPALSLHPVQRIQRRLRAGREFRAIYRQHKGARIDGDSTMKTLYRKAKRENSVLANRFSAVWSSSMAGLNTFNTAWAAAAGITALAELAAAGVVVSAVGGGFAARDAQRGTDRSRALTLAKARQAGIDVSPETLAFYHEKVSTMHKRREARLKSADAKLRQARSGGSILGARLATWRTNRLQRKKERLERKVGNTQSILTELGKAWVQSSR